MDSAHRIPSDEALGVARRDAEIAYGDLSDFRIAICLQSDGWHVDYELDNPGLHGGGPHYVIDAHSGEILSKLYEQ